MIYCSIDIETTGLDIERNDLIEVGAVMDDLANQISLEYLPRFHAYILRDNYCGSPEALAMHAVIFDRIANREKYPQYRFLKPDELVPAFKFWLMQNNYPYNEKKQRYTLNVTGKNAAGFDIPFLKKEADWKDIYFAHRVTDPATYYLRPDDERPPDMKTCMERAGIAGEVAHTAVEDALTVIQLLRHGIKRTVVSKD